MARTVTSILRIATLSLPQDVPLSIAAAIFVAAGVVILYIVNLIFAQRIIRAQHQRAGWHPIAHWFFIAVYAIIVLTLIMLITTVVQSYYTLDPHTLRIDRAFMLYGATTYAIISFLPIPLVLMSLLVPRRARTDKFGAGRFRTKIAILLLASALICSGACWRAGTSWVTPVKHNEPIPWYFQQAYFYFFDFGVEILTVYLYAILRVDRRFHIPNGAHGAGSYRAGAGTGVHDRQAGVDGSDEKPEEPAFRIYSEEETFDNEEEVPRSPDSNKQFDDLEHGIEHEPETKPPVLAPLDTSVAPRSGHHQPQTPETAGTDSTLRPSSGQPFHSTSTL